MAGQHHLVSLLLRYTVEAWVTQGDKFLCEDLRVHARACMGLGQSLVRIKLPLQGDVECGTEVLFDTDADADLLSIVDGKMMTAAAFHAHCIETLTMGTAGLLWYMVYDSPHSGRKICTGGLTIQIPPDQGNPLVISQFVSAHGSNTASVLWLYLVNLCDTRGHNICVVNPCQSPCIRWPLIVCGFLQAEDNAFVRVCTQRMVSVRCDAMAVAIHQLVRFMLNVSESSSKKNPIPNISISSAS
jgi:hypothetical protein